MSSTATPNLGLSYIVAAQAWEGATHNGMLRITQPDANIVTHYPGDIIKDSTGNYHFDLSISESGDWYYRYEGTGAVQAAIEPLFDGYRSNILT